MLRVRVTSAFVEDYEGLVQLRVHHIGSFGLVWWREAGWIYDLGRQHR